MHKYFLSNFHTLIDASEVLAWFSIVGVSILLTIFGIQTRADRDQTIKLLNSRWRALPAPLSDAVRCFDWVIKCCWVRQRWVRNDRARRHGKAQIKSRIKNRLWLSWVLSFRINGPLYRHLTIRDTCFCHCWQTWIPSFTWNYCLYALF